MESGEDAGASVANINKSPTGPNSWTVDGTGVGADVVNIARCCPLRGHCAQKWSSAPHSSHIIMSPFRLRGFLRRPLPPPLVLLTNGRPPQNKSEYSWSDIAAKNPKLLAPLPFP